MAELFFISKSLALQIHSLQIARFGGTLGIRDLALLESVLGAVRQTWDYSGDVSYPAAQYCYSPANNHPFLNGNKRWQPPVCWCFWSLTKNNQQWITPGFTNGSLIR